MKRGPLRLRIILPFAVVLAAIVSLFGGALVLAGNDDCLLCHQNMEYGEPKGDTERIHDASGKFLHEPHSALSCTDCHVDITEVPHRTGIERKIPCEACHN